MRRVSISVSWLCVLIAPLVYVTEVSGARASHGARRPVTDTTAGHPAPCPACDVRQCSTLLPEDCDGLIVKDECNCCPVCVEDDDEDLFIRPPSRPHNSSACEGVRCSRGQQCIINIQGIPLCRCLTAFWCRRELRSRPFCSQDGVTFKSRCYIRVQECSSGKKVRIAHRGSCQSSQVERGMSYPSGHPSLVADDHEVALTRADLRQERLNTQERIRRRKLRRAKKQQERERQSENRQRRVEKRRRAKEQSAQTTTPQVVLTTRPTPTTRPEVTASHAAANRRDRKLAKKKARRNRRRSKTRPAQN